MESIHLPSRRAWIDQKKIIVRDFLKEWTDLLKGFENNDFESSVSKHEFQETKFKCRYGATKTKYDDKLELCSHLDIPAEVNLDVLKSQEAELKKRESDNKYLTAHLAQMKFANYPPAKIPKIECKSKNSKFEPIDLNVPEVVLAVQIHAPERRQDPKVVNDVKMPSFHVNQEFLVLGCQYLTELREMIDCISDKAVPGDYSDNPHVVPTITCKDIYKSGYFYINDVFYNDMRDKDCKDYSEVVIQWSKNRDIGPFQKALMEETRFIDLTIQLGYPYLYVHQGDCEHLIVFTDLRVFSKEHDDINRNAYPMYTQIKPSKRIFCMVCRIYTAAWVVFDNKRLPENPYFFCKNCFFNFNYDENGQKIGSFRAYHYPDRTRLF